MLKVSRSRNKIVEPKLLPKNEQLGNTWNLKSKFKFQVFPSRQDRKTNSFVCFLGEVTAQQFCFEIYWPLGRSKNVGHHLWMFPKVVFIAGYTKTLAPLWSLFFRLEFYEHFDYKQDKSLSSVRLVCKNATKVLKRKDSSGSILKDGYVKKSDFTWVSVLFVCSQLEGWG